MKTVFASLLLSLFLSLPLLLCACPPSIDVRGKRCDPNGSCPQSLVCIAGTCQDVQCTAAVVGTGCTSGLGVCARMGIYQCVDNALTCSATPGAPTVEVCDGLDNDCNGMVDDGVNEVAPGGPGCITGLGACQTLGTFQCVNGQTICLAPQVDAGPEVCDGVDNDCNGIADDLPGCLHTLVGSGPPGRIDGPGSTAQFDAPHFLSTDDAGNTYVADTSNHSLRRIDPAGTVTQLVGTGRCGYLDGDAGQARLCVPYDVQPGPDGTLYFTDQGNQRLRRLDTHGVVTTLAGGGGFADGDAGLARFNTPSGLALDTGGILIADRFNNRIRRYDFGTRTVQTVAGPGDGGLDEGTAATVSLNQPIDVVPCCGGALVVSELASHRLRLIPLDGGTSSTLAGALDGGSGYLEGIGPAARFNQPTQLALSPTYAGVYVVDHLNNVVRQVPFNPAASTGYISGLPGISGLRNGQRGTSILNAPLGVAWQPSSSVAGGQLTVSDGTHRLRTVFLAPNFPTDDLAGGPAVEYGSHGELIGPRSAQPFRDGGWVWTESAVNVVRASLPDGGIITIAGTLLQAGDHDGDAQTARFNGPFEVRVTGQGELVVSDGLNHSIRRVDVQGNVTTLAGSDVGIPDEVDGTGTAARFNRPAWLALGSDLETVFVSDTSNRAVRQVDVATGQVTTVVGSRLQTAGDGGFDSVGPVANPFAVGKRGRLRVDVHRVEARDRRDRRRHARQRRREYFVDVGRGVRADEQYRPARIGKRDRDGTGRRRLADAALASEEEVAGGPLEQLHRPGP